MANEMKDKIVLVTGATNGIGQVTALDLAKMGATVVIVGRNRAKTEATVSEIKTRSGNENVDFVLGDLSVIAEVQHIADAFKERYSQLHVLVNNAGAVFSSRQLTADGYEMTFALNHLNYFLLTHLLLDTLKASAPARIVNVSSDAHRFGGGSLNFDNLQGDKSYSMGGFGVYGQSKLCNIMFTYELARRLQGTNVTVNALHPGNVRTGFGHNNRGIMDMVTNLFQMFGLTPEQGADTIIFLASSSDVEGISGQYFDKRKAVRSSDGSYDEAAQKRLWAISEDMTTVKISVV
jgi:NAD(P)-dependent dehydrogenase (short-subunit alcohol dehydrogenase family)